MRYHTVLMANPADEAHFNTVIGAEKNSERENINIRDGAEMKKDIVKNSLSKLRKKSSQDRKQNSPDLYYLYQSDNETSSRFTLATLINKLKDGDEIIIHAEGEPFVMGISAVSNFDVHARSLAAMLHTSGLEDKNISIQLLACNSAVEYEVDHPQTDEVVSINFARDLSDSLHYEFGYEKIKIVGYTGFIAQINHDPKYTVTPVLYKRNGGRQLRDAAQIYLNGELESSGAIVIDDLSKFAFSGSEKQIALAREGHLMTQQAKQSALISSINPDHVFNSKSAFFQASDTTDKTTKEKDDDTLDESNDEKKSLN